MTVAERISAGATYLGIELGSTRIKASLIGEDFVPLASGSYEWENRLENGYWTYSLEEIHRGVKGCYADLSAHVRKQYGVSLASVRAIGVSGMMHGYLAFDKDWNLLTPFRTWRNTVTGEASEQLTERFRFHIPQRWSIAHLYQAMLNGEAHVSEIAHLTTLAGYVHHLLTGRHELGVGEASGMFPIRNETYDPDMMQTFERLRAETGRVIVETFQNLALSYDEIPAVLVAHHGPFAWGKDAGRAVYHAAVLEEVAAMNLQTLALHPSVAAMPRALLDKHYLRKHGKNAYYGQN